MKIGGNDPHSLFLKGLGGPLFPVPALAGIFAAEAAVFFRGIFC
jgi:hypothetical protein